MSWGSAEIRLQRGMLGWKRERGLVSGGENQASIVGGSFHYNYGVGR